MEKRFIEKIDFDKMISCNFAKPIKGYENKYFITRDGGVISTLYKKKNNIAYLSQGNVSGYRSVSLCDNKGLMKSHYVHRLVATAFIRNKENKPEVNHIDEDKSNNTVNNLEWCTRLENIRHGTGIERKSFWFYITPEQTHNGETIMIWESVEMAAFTLGISAIGIRRCILGKQKKCGGYSWSG